MFGMRLAQMVGTLGGSHFSVGAGLWSSISRDLVDAFRNVSRKRWRKIEGIRRSKRIIELLRKNWRRKDNALDAVEGGIARGRAVVA